MLNTSHSKLLSIGTAALLVVGAGSAAAQDRPKDEDQKTVHEVIIKRMSKDGDRIKIDGRDLKELTAKCSSDDKQESDVTSGEGKDKFRTRVIICGDGAPGNPETRAKLAAALEKARDRLRGEDMLSDKGRAQALEALDREIARLRSGG